MDKHRALHVVAGFAFSNALHVSGVHDADLSTHGWGMAMGVLEDGAELARIPTAKMHAGVQVNPHATAYVRLKEPGPWAEIHGMADVVMEDIFDHVTRMVVPRFLRYF